MEQINSNLSRNEIGIILIGNKSDIEERAVDKIKGEALILDRTINILKSLPVKPFTIIMSKVYTAVLIMIPFI